jgi:hypothetical protein
MKDLHRWAERAYQSPISVTIFFKSLLSLSKEFKDGIGRVGKLELLSEGILREVYPSKVCVLTQGIND